MAKFCPRSCWMPPEERVRKRNVLLAHRRCKAHLDLKTEFIHLVKFLFFDTLDLLVIVRNCFAHHKSRFRIWINILKLQNYIIGNQRFFDLCHVCLGICTNVIPILFYLIVLIFHLISRIYIIKDLWSLLNFPAYHVCSYAIYYCMLYMSTL